ncbi:MAG: DUF4389 domain-containing protein [Nannocystaceae bacterium]
MRVHPVHFAVERPARFTPVQLLIRMVAFVVLGALGLSFGTLFSIAYVALPAYAAARIASLGSAEAYRRCDGARVRGILGWLAAVSAWVGLVTDRLPAASPDETIGLWIEDDGAAPTAGGALFRLLSGFPSAFVLMFVGAVGVVVWIWAALSILVRSQVPAGAFDYLVGVQRWSVRLLAYQACLVEAYPPFSFEDAPAPSRGPGATITGAEATRGA